MRIALLAAIVATISLAAGPACADTRIVNLSGKEVSTLLMRYKFDSRSSPTDRHLLLRDVTRDHFLVTLEKPCMSLKHFTSLSFWPEIEVRAQASSSYDLRFDNGAVCNIIKIQQVASKKAGQTLAEAELAAALAAEATEE